VYYSNQCRINFQVPFLCIYFSIYRLSFVIACLLPGVTLLFIPTECVSFSTLCQKQLWLCTGPISALFLDYWAYPDFMQPQRKKFNRFKLGAWPAHAIISPLHVHLSWSFLLKFSWIPCQNGVVFCHVVATFMLLFQEAHALHKE
jgi:hypothetical protein